MLSHPNAEIVVPGLPVAAPSFYADILEPLIHRLHSGNDTLTQQALVGRAFSSAMLCCVNAAYSFDSAAVHSLTAKILAHHGISRRAPPMWPGPIVCSRHSPLRCVPPFAPSRGFPNAHVDDLFIALVDRYRAPSAAPLDGAPDLTKGTRSISNADALLAACAAAYRAAPRAAARCARVRFPARGALPQLGSRAVLSAY